MWNDQELPKGAISLLFSTLKRWGAFVTASRHLLRRHASPLYVLKLGKSSEIVIVMKSLSTKLHCGIFSTANSVFYCHSFDTAIPVETKRARSESFCHFPAYWILQVSAFEGTSNRNKDHVMQGSSRLLCCVCGRLPVDGAVLAFWRNYSPTAILLHWLSSQ